MAIKINVNFNKTEDKGQVSQPVLKPVNPLWNKNVTPSPVIPRLNVPTSAPVVPRLQLPQATTNRIQTMKESALEPQKPTLRIPFNYKDTQQGSRGVLTAEAQRLALEQTPAPIAGTLGGIGSAFGIKNTPEQEQYLRDTKKGYGAYSVAGNIIGQIGGYGAVNAALKGTKLGATLVSTLGKKLGDKAGGYVASQGAQLLADAIVQAPMETLDAIQNDKSISEDAKQILINRAIDLGLNMAIQGGSDAFKKMMANKKVMQSVIDAGVPEAEIIRAIETNDQQAIKEIQNKVNIKGKEYKVSKGTAQGSVPITETKPSLTLASGQKVVRPEFTLNKPTENIYTPTQSAFDKKDYYTKIDKQIKEIDLNIKTLNKQVKDYNKSTNGEASKNVGRTETFGGTMSLPVENFKSQPYSKIKKDINDLKKTKQTLLSEVETRKKQLLNRLENNIPVSSEELQYFGIKQAPPIKLESPLQKRTLTKVPTVTNRLELPKLQAKEKLYTKTASMDAEKPKSLEGEYTLFKEERKVKSPKETADGKLKFRQTIHNSLMKADVSEQTKKIFDDSPDTYKALSNEKTWDDAYDTVSADADGVYDKLLKKDNIGSAQDTAEYVALIHKAESEGNIAKSVEIAKELASRGTSAGQAIQAISLLSKTTAEGKLVDIAKVINSAETAFKEADPVMGKEFAEKSKKVKDAVDGAKKEVERDVVDAVNKDKKANDIIRNKKEKELQSPEQMLAERVSSAITKEVEAKDRDLIKEMVSALFTKTKGKLGIETSLTPNLKADKFAQAVTNRQEYARVWQASKDILEKELSPELYKQIDDFIEKGVRPVFDEKQLDSMIKESFKDSNMTLDALVRKFSVDQMTDRNVIKQNIIDKLGITGSDADYLATFIENKLKDSIKTKKESILKSMFPEVKAKIDKPRTVLQDAVNLGALENSNYKSRLIEKLPAEIRDVMKSKDIKLDDIVRLSRDSQLNVSDDVANDILRKLNIDVKYADTVRQAAEESLKTMSDKRKKSIVDAMLKERKIYDPKPVSKRIEELYNLDALNELTKEKYKLPTLTNDEAKWIVDEMNKAQLLEGRAKIKAIEKVDQFIADKIPATFKEKVMALRNIQLLLTGKGRVRDLGSNAMNMVIETPTQVISGLTDWALSKMLKSQRETKIIPEFGARFKGLKEGTADLIDDIANGIDTSRMTSLEGLPRSRKIFEIALLNKLNNWVGYALRITDAPFNRAAFEGRLAELKKLRPDADEAELVEIARQWGKEMTFQNESATSSALAGIKQGANKIGTVGGVGIGDLSLPYTHTWGNILEKGVSYTPLGIINIGGKIGASALGQVGKKIGSTGLSKLTQYGVGANQKAFTDAVGRVFTGAGIIALGYKLRKDGFMTGRDKSTGKEKELKKQAGEQQYSIKIGDKWLSYDQSQPIAMVLAMGADMYEAGLSEKDVAAKIQEGLTSAGVTIFDQGAMQGFERLFGGMNGSPLSGTMETVANFPTQFLSGVGRQGAQFVDPYKRDVDYTNYATKLRDSAKLATPGLRQTLPTSLDMFGRPVLEQQGRKGVEKFIDSFISPIKKSSMSKDPTIKEIYRLYNALEDKDTGIIPIYVPDGLSFDEKRKFKLIYGPIAEKYVKMALESPVYKNGTDEQKADHLSKQLNKARNEAKKAYGIK